MEGEVLLLPITRREFRDAKMGKILEKRCQIDGDNFCVLISNKFIKEEQARNLMGLGFGVLPLDISEISWREIDRRCISNIVVEYENGIVVALISQNVYHQFEKENMDTRQPKYF